MKSKIIVTRNGVKQHYKYLFIRLNNHNQPVLLEKAVQELVETPPSLKTALNGC